MACHGQVSRVGPIRSASSPRPATPSATSLAVTLAFLVATLAGSWTPCRGDYIIPAAFPGQWLNRMAAEAELDRPSSFSLQHLHSGVSVRKRAPEQYDENLSYSLPAEPAPALTPLSSGAGGPTGPGTAPLFALLQPQQQQQQQQQHLQLQPMMTGSRGPLPSAPSLGMAGTPSILASIQQGGSSASSGYAEDLDEPRIVVSKRTALFMDKLMVALHNAINGNGKVPSAVTNPSADFELVTRQKNTLAGTQQTGAAWTKARKCYFNAVTCYGKRKRR